MKNIDFDNGYATLEKTKNDDVRVIPIPDQVTTYLKEIQWPKLPDDFIFPSKDPEKRNPYSLIRKAFKKAVQNIDPEIRMSNRGEPNRFVLAGQCDRLAWMPRSEV